MPSFSSTLGDEYAVVIDAAGAQIEWHVLERQWSGGRTGSYWYKLVQRKQGHPWDVLLSGVRSANPIPRGHSRVYRAVSEAEYQDVLRTGRFRQGPNALEGKWFADTVEGARLHGEALQGAGKYRIIEVDVPDSAPSLFKQPNLDGRGPARFLHLDDLNNVSPRPWDGG